MSERSVAERKVPAADMREDIPWIRWALRAIPGLGPRGQAIILTLAAMHERDASDPHGIPTGYSLADIQFERGRAGDPDDTDRARDALASLWSIGLLNRRSPGLYRIPEAS